MLTPGSFCITLLCLSCHLLYIFVCLLSVYGKVLLFTSMIVLLFKNKQTNQSINETLVVLNAASRGHQCSERGAAAAG